MSTAATATRPLAIKSTDPSDQPGAPGASRPRLVFVRQLMAGLVSSLPGGIEST